MRHHIFTPLESDRGIYRMCNLYHAESSDFSKKHLLRDTRELLEVNSINILDVMCLSIINFVIFEFSYKQKKIEL